MFIREHTHKLGEGQGEGKGQADSAEHGAPLRAQFQDPEIMAPTEIKSRTLFNRLSHPDSPA